eukprot:Rhum_TRINITY_DN15034_c0_g1::Rhum_TRINITY_DN15034_c0_g1_i2::g.134063::m.134063
MDIFLRRPNGQDVCVEVSNEDFTVGDALRAARLVAATLSRDGVTCDAGTRLRDLGLQEGDTLDVKPTEAAAAQQYFKERGLKMTYDALVNAVASCNEERVRGLLHCVSLTEGHRGATRKQTWGRQGLSGQFVYRAISEGLPVLMVAAQYSTPAIVRMLLRAGEDPNQRGTSTNGHSRRYRRGGRPQKPTALHYAAKVARDSGNMEALLDGGADPNLVDAFDCTPLMILAERRDDVSDLIGVLVARGAEVDKVSAKKMALGRAAMRGNVANVRALLENGAVGACGVLRLPETWNKRRTADETAAIKTLLKEHHVRLANYDRVFTYDYLLNVHAYTKFEEGYIYCCPERKAVIALLESAGVNASEDAGKCAFTLHSARNGGPSLRGLQTFFSAVLSCPTGSRGLRKYMRDGQDAPYSRGGRPRPVSPELLAKAEQLFAAASRKVICEDEESLPNMKEENRRSWAVRHHKR